MSRRPESLPAHFRFALHLLIAGVPLLGGGAALAQSSDDCMACHAERGMTGTRNGREIGVTVDRKLLASSVHGPLDCVSCHQSLSGKDLPHEPGVPLVDCAACHEREGKDYRASAHGRAADHGDPTAARCPDCHGPPHGILASADPRSPVSTINVPATCGRCHHEGSEVSTQHHIPEERILENYSESIHGEGLFKKGLTVTAVCSSCHSAHLVLPHEDARSSTNRANIAKTCTRCHARIEVVHQKVVNGKLWEKEPHKVPSCTDCHTSHKIRRSAFAQGMATKDCLLCHGKPELAMTRGGKRISLFVDDQQYAASTHARVACAQCHVEVRASLRRACEAIKSRVDCSSCHAAVVDVYWTSIHGKLYAKGDADAPGCLDCHDKHATKSKRWPNSPTFARAVPDLCGRCHRAGEKAARRIHTQGPDIVKSYRESIHGVGLLEAGLVVTATCADCHTAHGELPPNDPASTVSRERLIETCSKCHQRIGDVFRSSIHGAPSARSQGKKLPICEDCHTSHQISRTDVADFRMLMMRQCGNCHRKEADTFFETYHGKVSRLGDPRAAKCYDCHGTHDIRPPSDPASRLSHGNVVRTCGKCHQGSHRQFAGYLTHATHHDSEKYPILFFVFWAMTTLLVGTLAVATTHTGAWLWRLWRTRETWRVHRSAGAEQVLVRRFNATQRSMHLVMLVCFLTLALTGMALKFSYMTWSRYVAEFLGGTGGMGGLHRLAAVTLCCVFGLHIRELFRLKKESGGNWLGFIFGPESMMFNQNDLREVRASVKWFFGRGPHPNYGRFTYWEKFDYFAVFWGIFVIGSTGLVLWFPAQFTRLLPGWSINVATIIHSDEALLAAAFIFTVHFFNTHFRPDKFPMDPVIFTGSVPLEELKYDKPREYQRLVDAGQLESATVPPMPEKVERGLRIFGFAALAVGLFTVALIVYSMVFAYR